MYSDLHVRYPLLFSDFNYSSIFLTGFQKILKFKENFSSVSQGVPCRQTGRHDKREVAFLNSVNVPKREKQPP